MRHKSLTTLEFNKIIDQLCEKATSFPGKEHCKKVKPMTDPEQINRAQDETAAACDRLIRGAAPSFAGCQPVNDSLKRLSIGGSLSGGELLRIGALLTCAGHVKDALSQEDKKETGDCLTPYLAQLSPLPQLAGKIHTSLPDAEEVSDEASPGLAHVRRQIAQTQDKIHETLTAMVNGPTRNSLQDPIITLRGDRYCLPVKAEEKNRVPGVIHDESATGSTLFIEPASVVKLNNELRALYGKEKEEIQAVLDRLSEETADHIPEIRTDYQVLGQLDFLFAKGALALQMDAMRPDFNTEGQIRIRDGRHPLLDPKQVVPIQVSLGESYDQLIVTGPNTGGKTVSLKTVGLLEVMGLSGLFIPAREGSRLAVFTDIYADIGDEQSIEQSLSTFSAHLSNIVSFISQVDEHSLVLLDELGAGTDPTEGAALATAILRFLHERGIRTMATTHYSELKVYALQTPGVENASCEFDVETLSPTYRLITGIPGKSNAFAIAGKLGLPDPIIEAAQADMSDQEASLEDVLGDLQERRQKLEAEEAQIADYKQTIEAEKAQAEKERTQIQSQKDQILSEAHAQALSILSEAKETADTAIHNFRKYGSTNASAAEMEKERDKIRRAMDDSRQALAPAKKSPARTPKARDVRQGDTVHVISMDLKGTVTSLPDAKGMVTVQMGILSSRLPVSDLELIEEADTYPQKTAGKSGAGSGVKMSKSLTVSPEINLLGKTVDEAVSALDKYLDDASLAHLKSVRIVHGKGTGALRSGVHQYLKTQPHVKSFRLGGMGEGDAGVTIAELK